MSFFLMKPKIYFNSSMEKVFIESRIEKVCIITDSTIKQLKLVEMLEDILKKLKVDYFIYSDIELDPSVESIKKGIVHIVKKNPKWIIALGGGSVIDSAKSINYFLNKLERVRLPSSVSRSRASPCPRNQKSFDPYSPTK